MCLCNILYVSATCVFVCLNDMWLCVSAHSLHVSATRFVLYVFNLPHKRLSSWCKRIAASVQAHSGESTPLRSLIVTWEYSVFCAHVSCLRTGCGASAYQGGDTAAVLVVACHVHLTRHQCVCLPCTVHGGSRCVKRTCVLAMQRCCPCGASLYRSVYAVCCPCGASAHRSVYTAA